MKPNMKKALLGGVVGTVVMTMMMHFVAPMMTGQPMDIAAMIGGMMGDNYMIGMMMHLMMGIVIFPLMYVFLAFRFVPGPTWGRGVALGIVLWLMAAAVVMPMAGAGFFMSEIGGMSAVIAALMGHVVYGALLGAIAGNGED